MTKPLAIDLFCGLFGWSDGLTAAGLRTVGFDIEDMPGQFGLPRPAHTQLVIQDVRTLHGSQFKDAALIVASPPCQRYSYMGMPWKKAKALAEDYRSGRKSVADLNELFDACFRIQREACEAAGRHIPLVVENVCGAQRWVGPAAYHYGSFYLWGDVPALMPSPAKLEATKVPGMSWSGSDQPGYKAEAFNGNAERALKNPGFRFDGRGQSFQQACVEGIKCGGVWFVPGEQSSISRRTSSKSTARKFASAMIAKIPFALSKWIGHVAVTEAVA